MHPSSHLIVSWLVGQHLAERRDRLLVAYAGAAPDLDGLSLLAGVDAYGQWHHVLTHGLRWSGSLQRGWRKTGSGFP
jgi:hypothetical protein